MRWVLLGFVVALSACAQGSPVGGDAASSDARSPSDGSKGDARPDDASIDAPIDAPEVPLPIVPTMQEAYLKAALPRTTDQFGNSVAVSMEGTTIAVGAWVESGGSRGINGNPAAPPRTGSGAVYVFRRTGGVWMQEAYIKSSNADAHDAFGQGLGLSASGDVLAVGAFGESSAATGVGGDQSSNTAPGAGAVYVFRRSGTTWTQEAYLKASNTDAGDELGKTLSLSADGNTLVACAPSEDSSATGVGGDQTDDGTKESGAAYVFRRGATGWTQDAYIKATNTFARTAFCYAAAISGDAATLAVASNQEASNASGVGGNQFDISASGSGAVYVYRFGGATWAPEAYVKATNPEGYSVAGFIGDLFGSSVALTHDGSRLAVGAINESSAATGIDGDQDNNDAPYSGAAYVYRRTGSTWSHEAYIKASNTGGGQWFAGDGDLFGIKLSLSADGRRLAVGAPSEASAATGIGGAQGDNTRVGAGAVYVFQRTGTTWMQDAYVKASNTEAADRFGMAPVLAGDGRSLVVGAREEDSGSPGINGNQLDNTQPAAGAVYVFR